MDTLGYMSPALRLLSNVGQIVYLKYDSKTGFTLSLIFCEKNRNNYHKQMNCLVLFS